MPDMDVAQRPAERLRPQTLAALWLASFLLYVAGNGGVPLWDRDESRYAQATVQMLLRGDYLVPYYLTYDQSGDPARPDPRFHKPPIVYWTQAAACSVFGTVDEFGVRFPSAVFGASAVVVIALLGQTLLGPRIGFWAAAVLAVAPLMQVMSKICLCDAPLLFFTGAAMWLLALQFRHGPHAGRSAAMWALLGLGILSKGPVTFLFFLSPVLFLAAFGGPEIRSALGAALSPLRLPASVPLPVRALLHALAGPAIALGLAATWVVPVEMATWDFVRFDDDAEQWVPNDFLTVSIGTHVKKRMFTPMESHGGPPGYYVVLVLVTFFPWSLLLPLSMWSAFRRRPSSLTPDPSPLTPDPSPTPPPDEPWVRLFLMGWAVFPWVFLEFHATKLPHYFLPTVPALAILTARFLCGEASAASYWKGLLPRTLGWAAVAVIAVVTLGFCVVAFGVRSGIDVPGAAGPYLSDKHRLRFDDLWTVIDGFEPAALAWIPVLTATAIGLTAWGALQLQAGRVLRGAAGWVAMCGVGGLLLSLAVLPQMTFVRTSPRTAEWIKANVPDGPVVLVGFEDDGDPGHPRANYDEPSLVFYLGGRVRVADSAPKLWKLLHEPGPVTLVADRKYAEVFRRHGLALPEPAAEFQGVNYVKGRPAHLQVFLFRQTAAGRKPAGELTAQ
jgi:4-amino-4-deoxy-L-arabinose transferase-like glycosyltransferase